MTRKTRSRRHGGGGRRTHSRRMHGPQGLIETALFGAGAATLFLDNASGTSVVEQIVKAIREKDARELTVIPNAIVGAVPNALVPIGFGVGLALLSKFAHLRSHTRISKKWSAL